MAICEECGSIVELTSFDALCADCEHIEKVSTIKQTEDAITKLLYIKDVYDALPVAQKKIMRNCDECIFSRASADEMHMSCLKYHRPKFYQPKSGDFTSGEWGWRRKCEDFRYKKPEEALLLGKLIGDAQKGTSPRDSSTGNGTVGHGRL